MKRCEVPYDRLTIETNILAYKNHYPIENLFDYRRANEHSAQGLCKYHVYMTQDDPSTGERKHFDWRLTIKLKDEYPDLILTDYAIITANDEPDIDPGTWFLTYGPEVEDDQADRIHEVQGARFNDRWAQYEFKITKKVPAREWHLVI